MILIQLPPYSHHTLGALLSFVSVFLRVSPLRISPRRAPLCEGTCGNDGAGGWKPTAMGGGGGTGALGGGGGGVDCLEDGFVVTGDGLLLDLDLSRSSLDPLLDDL